MAFFVKRSFFDLQDNNHPYNAGDAFPRIGVKASPARIAELSGSNNRLGVPLIYAADDSHEKKRASSKRTEGKQS